MGADHKRSNRKSAYINEIIPPYISILQSTYVRLFVFVWCLTEREEEDEEVVISHAEMQVKENSDMQR